MPKDKTIRGAIALRMQKHFTLMGIQLPSDSDSKREMLSNFNQMICEKNTSFPANTDVVRLYHSFFNAIESGAIEKPLRSAFAYGQAFRDWARNKDLIANYGLKQLPEPTSSISAEDLYAKESDESLQESHDGLLSLLEVNPSMGSQPMTKNHIDALLAEMIKRKLPIHPQFLP